MATALRVEAVTGLKPTIAIFQRSLPSVFQTTRRTFSQSKSYKFFGRYRPIRQCQIYGVEGDLNGIPAFASIATESRHNVVSSSFIRECGLTSESSRTAGQNARGLKIGSEGSIKATWTFSEDDGSDHQATFEVLPHCPHSILLGQDFVQRTKTLTTNWHRVRRKDVESTLDPSVNLFGQSSFCVFGSISGEPIHALAATGCERSLVSAKFVQRRKAHRGIFGSKKAHVAFVDGTTAQTHGRIAGVWAFGDDPYADAFLVEFGILPDLPYDVVLGQDLLFGTNAFLNYPDFFHEHEPTLSSSDSSAGLHAIPLILLSTKPRLGKDRKYKSVNCTGANTSYKLLISSTPPTSRTSLMNCNVATKQIVSCDK